MSNGGGPLTCGDATTLDCESWPAYFDSLTGTRRDLLAAVALPGPDGDARWEVGERPLHAIDYDHLRDEIEVAVRAGQRRGAALRYFVGAPRAIVLEQAAPHVMLLRVTDARGAQTLIRLRDAGAGRHTESHSSTRITRSPRAPINHAPSA